MDLGLEGKVALVTAGSKGVGRGVADALVAEGCHVYICSRDEEEVRRAAEEIEEVGASGSRVLAVAADLTNGEDHQRLVDETLDEFGSIDIWSTMRERQVKEARSKTRRSRRGGASSS